MVLHIEEIGDLTADEFIAALRRFSVRRRDPRLICSNNAMNFIGANQKLSEIQRLWASLPKKEAVAHHLTQASTEWHFIPPVSPHFGGI